MVSSAVILTFLTATARQVSADAAAANSDRRAETVFRASLWAPPKPSNSNNLTFALSAHGTDGKIYNSSTVSDSGYGVYNYCNMPHVRPAEYIIPLGYDLQYVEVIHRHHKRTPYRSNAFSIEDVRWDCDDTELYYYGQPAESLRFNAIRVHRDIYDDPLNPLKTTGYRGKCDFPQITADGLEDAFVHGKDLFDTYSILLNFIPPTYDDNEIIFRVTSNVITSQVAGALLAGMYPTASTIRLLQQRPEIDSLEPQYSCPYAKIIMSEIRASDEWIKHLKLTKPFYATLDKISDVKPSEREWHDSLDHYFDDLSSRMCHQKPLPCKIGNGSNCITQDMADKVMRLGQWEYNYLYRSSLLSIEYARTHYGIFFTELMVRMKKGKGYRHNIAHDGSISSVLSILQVEEMVWPGMGGEIVFERWWKDGKRFVRVLWNGMVLRSSRLGNVDMMLLEDLLGYFEEVVGVDGEYVLEKCEL